MDELNLKWAYIEGDLDLILGYDTSPDWESFGFDIARIRWAVSQKYQLSRDGVLISMFPIYNETTFNHTLGHIFYSDDKRYRVLTQDEVDEIHAPLLLSDAEYMVESMNTPSEDEIYRSQILLLLTEIKLNTQGLINNG